MSLDENAVILDLSNVSMHFGGIKAISHIQLQIKKGVIHAIIGPNGAGKTTLFNCLTGIYKPTEGQIFYSTKSERRKLNHLRSDQIAKLGIARTFQNIRLFPKLSALENVMIGRICRSKSNLFSILFRTKLFYKEEKETYEKCFQLLVDLGLEKFVEVQACNLSYAVQKKLEIARALALEPILLLLDEPAAGMNPKETEELSLLVRKIKSAYGLSVILIEHDMKFVMDLADVISVLDQGKKIAEGTPKQIRHDQMVIAAYLGNDDA